ncbi:inositol monophosphatase family protein [Leptolyngbya sp. FACHB-671]|uniref:3'(2'),5'-bisphosphate nucleotidase CysQ family protein n=1 Tax=Leptolyngbya sp. FACHB-671 TaxID=2692812 RepID=UPI00321FB201
MTITMDAERLLKIHHLVQGCGQQAKQMATQPLQVFEKSRHDYVTNVDRLLDQQLSEGIANLFPQDGIITEENAHSRQSFRSEYSRFWFIDPIDGTSDFIHGKPHYAVMVGLLEANQPTAGWIYAPALDQMYWGGLGLGLFQSTGRTPTDAVTSIDQITQNPLILKEPTPPSQTFCPVLIGSTDRRRYEEAMTHLIPEAQFTSIGSFGLKVMEVVCGRAGLYVYLSGRVKLWDTVGPIALARAAGLVCCDLAGNPLHFTPDAIEPETLTHCQSIVVGWASYVEALRSRLQKAVLLSQP